MVQNLTNILELRNNPKPKLENRQLSLDTSQYCTKNKLFIQKLVKRVENSENLRDIWLVADQKTLEIEISLFKIVGALQSCCVYANNSTFGKKCPGSAQVAPLRCCFSGDLVFLEFSVPVDAIELRFSTLSLLIPHSTCQCSKPTIQSF